MEKLYKKSLLDFIVFDFILYSYINCLNSKSTPSIFFDGGSFWKILLIIKKKHFAYVRLPYRFKSDTSLTEVDEARDESFRDISTVSVNNAR